MPVVVATRPGTVRAGVARRNRDTADFHLQPAVAAGGAGLAMALRMLFSQDSLPLF